MSFIWAKCLNDRMTQQPNQAYRHLISYNIIGVNAHRCHFQWKGQMSLALTLNFDLLDIRLIGKFPSRVHFIQMVITFHNGFRFLPCDHHGQYSIQSNKLYKHYEQTIIEHSVSFNRILIDVKQTLNVECRLLYYLGYDHYYCGQR